MSQEILQSKSKKVFPGIRKQEVQQETSKRKQINDAGEKQKKSGIDVICRVRPQLIGEKYGFSLLVNFIPVPYKIKALERNEIEINETFTDSTVQKKYRFNAVLDQDASQESIQNEFVVKIIQEMFHQKKSALIFSYGVTNSGKTFTIVGNDEHPGVLPQTLNCLLEIREAIQIEKEFHIIGTKTINFEPMDNFPLYDLEIGFQAYEIYKEDIYDLLQERKFNKEKIKLQIKENGDRKFTVRDVREQAIDSKQNIKQILDYCLTNRQMGETILNMQSSRSHTIFKINLKFIYRSKNKVHDIVLEQSLCIVDLAGSERSKKAETQGSQLNEACNINKSLLVLGRCLKMLKFQPTESHIVPFRECKLTRVLCEYFTEDNNILMIVNVRLTSEGLDETLKVLNFGSMGVHITLLKSRLGEQPISFRQIQQVPEEQIEELKIPQSIEPKYLKLNLLPLTYCAQHIKSTVSCFLKTMEIDKLDQLDQIKQILNEVNRQKSQTPKLTQAEKTKESEPLILNDIIDKKSNSLSRNSFPESLIVDEYQSQSQKITEGQNMRKSLETIQERESEQQSSVHLGSAIDIFGNKIIISEVVDSQGIIQSQNESVQSIQSSQIMKDDTISSDKQQFDLESQNIFIAQPSEFNFQQNFIKKSDEGLQQIIPEKKSLVQSENIETKHFQIETVESIPIQESYPFENYQQEPEKKSVDSIDLLKIVEYQQNQEQVDQSKQEIFLSEDLFEISKQIGQLEPFKSSEEKLQQQYEQMESQKFYSFGNQQLQQRQIQSEQKNQEQLDINNQQCSFQNDSLNLFECSNLFEGLSKIVDEKDGENMVPCFGDQLQRQIDQSRESRIQKTFSQLSVESPKTFFQQLKFMQTTQISEQEDFRKKILQRLKGNHQQNLDESINQENQPNLPNLQSSKILKSCELIPSEAVEKQKLPQQSLIKESKSRSKTPVQSKSTKHKASKKQTKKQKQKNN